jgi:hypothetical protein
MQGTANVPPLTNLERNSESDEASVLSPLRRASTKIETR